MKVIIPGHRYALENMISGESPQELQFVTKAPGAEPVDGTTNEEVLAMLVDRLKNLQAVFPCRENALAITKLEEANMWLEARTRDRNRRGVEGRALP